MFKHLCLSFALLLGAAMTYSAAHAADNTRYVSITGKNANPCTLAQPCKTLQRGIAMTPAGGEVQILESGFYGNLANINKSLTITGNGNTVYLGGVLTINNAGATVALRNLILDGQDTIATGISIAAAASVHIDRCVVHGFTQTGIRSTAAGTAVFVSDSVSRNNVNGLDVSGASRLTIDNSRFENNSNQGAIVSGGPATIRGSTSSGNGSNGFNLFNASVSVLSTVASQNASAGFSVQGGAVTVESSVAHENFFGLSVFGGGTARVSNSTFTENNTGLSNTGSTLQTRENNTVRGNTANDTSGTLTVIGGV
jgi:hypothetical protein